MDDLAARRDLAWIGDAVLALFAREYLLAHPELEKQFDRQMLFARLTSNHFLARFGEPTTVEASFGRRYREEGLAATFAHLEATLLPAFRKDLHKRRPGGRKSAP